MNIGNPASELASYGTAAQAIGPASMDDIYNVVSLGDGGSATVSFAWPMVNAPGPDLAVFENSFNNGFLELGYVEVSSNGRDYFRFPSTSLTQTQTQVGTFGQIDPTNLDGLAGKYHVGLGTPFDLDALVGVSPLLNVNFIVAVRVVDVVGSIDPRYARYDAQGNKINEAFTTPFATGGFDLDAVAMLSPFGGFLPIGIGVPSAWTSQHPDGRSIGIPEPSSLGVVAVGCIACHRKRKTRQPIRCLRFVP